MRNRTGKKFLLPLLGLSLALGSSLVFASSKKNTEQVDAYSASSLPTTIDLNDTSASNIRSYYSSLNNLATNQRQGTNLLKNLKTILKNNQKYYSYDSSGGDNIWKMYEITDRDWDKSPASGISGYNSSTKVITGYSYNSTDPYVHALYINRDVTNQTKAWANHNQDQWGINREHVWPKAEGFDTSGAGGARGDPMHLMAGNGYANNIHSNYFYGYVKTSSSYTDCGSKYSNQSGNLRGTSKTLNSGTVFEPQDSDKGDIARAIFYMVARYNYLSGSDSDGINSNNPNLTLTQNVSDWASSGYTSTTSTTGKMGIMTDLLAWHHADPVDEYEIHRNNLLYTNFTNNRNPFIDFPEWADFIWGSVNYNGSTYVSHSTTPTGYATPSSDTINGYNSGGATISVTGVSLNKNSTSIVAGSNEALSATIAPSNATNQGLSWASSDDSVATVSNSGRVTAVAEGSATITVTTSDGGFTDTCAVTVTASGGGGGGGGTPVDDTMIAKGFGGYTTSSYSAAGTDYTGVANLTNSSGSTYAMQVFNGSTGQVRGNQSTASANFSCRNTTTYSGYYVSQVSLTVDSGGTLDGSTTDRSVVWFGSSAYANPTTAPSSGTKVAPSPASSGQSTLTWSNSNTDYNYFILYNLKAANAPKCKDADTPLVVTWTPIPSSDKTLDSITLDTSDAQTTFNVGDTFTYNGLTVTANYDDGTDDIVTPTSVSTPNMSTAGQKTVTVSYTEGDVTKTATYTITVKSVTLDSISVVDPKTSYFVGDSFDEPEVIATYSDGTTSDVTSNASFSGYNLSNAGNQTVTVSYTTGGTTRSTSYSITVTAVSVTSIEISGYTTTFRMGDEFAFGGTVTANYNNGTSSTVTNDATFTGYDLSTAGSQTVTVSYGGQSTTYSITVSESSGGTDTTQYSLVTSIDGLELGKSYIITNGIADTVKAIAVTSNTNNRKTTDVTISDSKITRGSDVMSFTLGGSSGAYTFATENYAGTAGYLASAASGNYNYLRVIQTAGTATITFNNDAAVINIGPHSTRTLIQYNANNGNPIFACYSGGQSAVYLWKEISTSPSLTWTSPTINVYSGSTLTGTDVNGWGITYDDGSGNTTVLTYSQVTIKLGGTTISIPHTWVVTNDGKALTATYSSLTTTESTAVQVTQTVNNIYKESSGDSGTVSWTATAANNLGSQISSEGGTDTGTISTGDYSWNYTRTLTSLASGKSDNISFQGSTWIQLGSNNSMESLVLETDEIPGTITSISVVTATAGSHVLTIDVGGTKYLEDESLTLYSGTAAAANPDPDDCIETGTGTSSGAITITIAPTASTKKAMLIRSISVTYESSGTTQQIANSLEHISAQRVAVKFAKAFNAAMDTTSNCTTNLTNAWTTCSAAYTTFVSEAAALGEPEEAYAKDLIRCATVRYSDDSGEACIERMLKTYEICVQKHGKNAFMSDLITLSSPKVSPLLNVIGKNTNTIAIVVIISMVSVTAIGGYFFLHKRKEQI